MFSLRQCLILTQCFWIVQCTSSSSSSSPSSSSSGAQSHSCLCIDEGSYCQFGGNSCPFAGTCHGSTTKCDCTDCGIDPFGKVDPQCAPCETSPSPSIAPWVGSYPFDLWYDPPGSAAYSKLQPKWYDLIVTRSGENFTSTGPSGENVTVHVNMGEHGAIHLFADPAFQQSFDDKVRDLNGEALARDKTGVVDRCGWPNLTASEAPDALQYIRRRIPLHEDFSHGLTNESWSIALAKGCCEFDDDERNHNPYHANLNIVKDVVNGKEKNVLALTAWNEDDKGSCPGPQCFKNVRSSGTVSTADVFGSGRYEVVAKVANAPGLVWALWTFHYEEHLPSNCAHDECWCAKMPDISAMVAAQCELRADGSSRPCKFANVCNNNTDGWDPTPRPQPPAMTPAECGGNHSSDDPQFLGNASIGGWTTMLNHEIDIEIPANCVGQLNVCNVTAPDNVSGTCVGQYNTANLNNYQYTQNSGTGPAYSNMCVRATKKNATGHDVPQNFIGDGRYHNYTIVWHTGGQVVQRTAQDGTTTSTKAGFVDFYIDGLYLGTNNAFVPTRGGKFFIAHWYPNNRNHLWNGLANTWGGGFAGDNKTYNMTTLVSEVHITPFNEPRDIMYPSTDDQPDGCTPNYHQPYASSPAVCHPVWTPPPPGLGV